MRSLFQQAVLNLAVRAARGLYPSGVVRVTETLRRPRGVLLMPAETLADVLHALPVVAALRRRYPETRIALLARPDASDLLADADGLDEAVLAYPLAPPTSWSAFRRVVAEIRARSFDTLLSLDREYDRVKALVGYLSGAPVRVGYGGGRDAGLYNVRVAPAAREAYQPLRNLALLESVGIDTNGVDVRWRPTEAEHRIAEQLLALRGPAEGPLVALEARPGAPLEHPALEDWIGGLRERFGARILVVREAPPAAAFLGPKAEGGGADLACRSIREVLALLSCCDLFVCEDTRLLHFAWAMDVPTAACLPPDPDPVLQPAASGRWASVPGGGLSPDDRDALVRHLVPAAAAREPRPGRPAP